MAGNNEKDFEELMKKRADLVEKLKKLENKKGTTKEKIYLKVKLDYEERLRKIDGEMEEYTSLTRERISKLQEEEENLKAERESYADRIEEIRLRYELGEFEEEDYKDVLEEEEKELDKIDKGLVSIANEIASLQGLIKEEEKGAKELVEEVVEEQPTEIEKEEGIGVLEKEFEESFETTVKGKPEEGEIAESLEASLEESIDDLLKEAEGTEKGTKTEEEETIASEIIPEGEAVKEETSKLEGFPEDQGELSAEEGESEKEEKGKEEEGEEEEEIEGLVCPKCGFVNSKDSWYCEKCGAELLQ